MCTVFFFVASGGGRRGCAPRPWRRQISVRRGRAGGVRDWLRWSGLAVCLLSAPPRKPKVASWERKVAARAGSGRSAPRPAARSGELWWCARPWLRGGCCGVGCASRFFVCGFQGCGHCGVYRQEVVRLLAVLDVGDVLVVFFPGREGGGCWNVWPRRAGYLVLCDTMTAMARCCGGGGVIQHRQGGLIPSRGVGGGRC